MHKNKKKPHKIQKLDEVKLGLFLSKKSVEKIAVPKLKEVRINADK